MKSVMISIRPEWVAKIMSGEKTVEVRKTVPKLPTPFKCYIYETQGKTNTPWIDEEGHMIFRGRGEVVAEFVCNDIRNITAHDFIVREDAEKALKGSGLTPQDAKDYAGWKPGMQRHECKPIYGWRISGLKIYDKPKKITDFSVIRMIPVEYAYGTAKERYTLERPPQSWCYVEELR